MPVVNLVSETVGGTTGHGVHTAFLQTLGALQRAGVDVRVNSADDTDIAHIQTMGLRSLRQLLRTRERAVVTAHIVPESLVGSFMWARLWLPIATAYMLTFYSLADEVLAVSPEVSGGLHRLGLRVPVRVVPNAIDTLRLRPQAGWREDIRMSLGVADDDFVALCAGQIQPRKGIDDFLATARAMPDVTFVWVGGMPFKRLTDQHNRMRALVTAAPANCRFVGEVAYEDMPRWYASADCLFFPSHQETFGLAIAEAGAAGLPLILRNLETYPPLFGTSYVACDSSGFVSAISRLRDSAAERAHRSEQARQIAERFDTARLSETLLQVYGDVLARSEAERAASARRLRPVLRWTLGAGFGRD